MPLDPSVCHPATGATVQHPKLRALLAHWQAAADPIPDRSLVDPLALGPWLGNLMLIDVVSPQQFRYRLYGSEFVAAFGREWTGHDLAELPEDQHRLIRQEYAATVATRGPTVRQYRAHFETPLPGGAMASGGGLATWERLVLPIADADGAITLLLVAAYDLAAAEG